MSESSSSRMRCPTCRAEQEWSDTCRRCQSDLRLLRETLVAGENQRQRVLRLLQAGRFPLALCLAQELVLIDNQIANRRLLALCHLLAEDLDQALLLAEHLEDS